MQSVLDRSKLLQDHNKKATTVFTKTVAFKREQQDDLIPIIRHTKAELAPTRQKLPIYEFRDALIHAVEINKNVVVVGETGSGKTTQVPQYLYEAHLVPNDPKEIGTIAITQPRRVAAMTLAERVSQEVGTALGDAVGYTIRFDDKSSPQTKLKFLTDGMLLRELQIDPKLSRYKIIVLDEAHERTLNTDVLFGLLKTLQASSRPDLKLVVMSATLDADKFSTYLDNCPVALIPGRTHPVDVYYLDNERIATEFKKDEVNLDDSNDIVVRTVMQLHQDKPLDGDILVFMPGSDDIESVKEILQDRSELLLKTHKEQQETLWLQHMAQKLSKSGRNALGSPPLTSNDKQDDNGDCDDLIQMRKNNDPLGEENSQEMDCDDDDGHETLDHHTMNTFLASIGQLPPPNLHILPLYSTLAPELQLQAFAPAPPGTRKVILSTNIAETSVTVSGVKYVIDTGLAKIKIHDHKHGVGSLQSHVISRAEAQQRTGRAGREQPGECYRLYTEEAFEYNWVQTPLPEIARATLSSIILNLLSLKININKFPLIDKPSVEAIKAGYKELLAFNAIQHKDNEFVLTQLGRLMATFPIEPVYSRLLILAARPELLWLAELPEDLAREMGEEAKESLRGHKYDGISINKKTQIADLKSSQRFLQQLTLENMKKFLSAKGDKDYGDLDESILCHPCSEEMCIMIAALSVENLVKTIPDSAGTRVLKMKIETLQREHYSPYGDYFFYYNILRQFLFLNSHEKRDEFCRRYYYNYRNLNQALNVYKQLCELIIESNLPLVSAFQSTHPKKLYRYADFLRNRANISSESQKDKAASNPGKQQLKSMDNSNNHTRSSLIQCYLNENPPIYQYYEEDYDFDNHNTVIKKRKLSKNGGQDASEDKIEKSDEEDWEENLAKCLTSGFYSKFAQMNESSKYKDHSTNLLVQTHPSASLNWYIRGQMEEWKEKKKTKQAGGNQVTKNNQVSGPKVKDLQQFNSSAKQSSVIQGVNMAKTGQGQVPQHFKDYTDYQYLCYGELINTKNWYIRGCFRTRKEWLEVYSRGSYRFDSIDSMVDEMKNQGSAYDESNSQLNNSLWGKKSAHSNLTGKTLAHTVGLSAGKGLGLQKSIIDHNLPNVSKSDGKVEKRASSKLSIGLGGSSSTTHHPDNHHKRGKNNNNKKLHQFVALDVNQYGPKFTKTK